MKDYDAVEYSDFPTTSEIAQEAFDEIDAWARTLPSTDELRLKIEHLAQRAKDAEGARLARMTAYSAALEHMIVSLVDEAFTGHGEDWPWDHFILPISMKMLTSADSTVMLESRDVPADVRSMVSRIVAETWAQESEETD